MASSNDLITPDLGNEINLSHPHPIYDNNVTVGYKLAKLLDIPINFLILHTRGDPNSPVSGINEFKGTIFESLDILIDRLRRTDNPPNEVHNIIQELTTFVTDNDILFTYYILLYNDYKDNPPAPYYILLNQIFRDMGGGDIIRLGITVSKGTDEALRFQDDADLQREYAAWTNANNERKNIDSERLAVILNIQRQLYVTEISTDPLLISPVTIVSTIVSFSPTLDGRSIGPDDGLDIFNQSVVSKYVPFIRYNDKYGKSKIRVYTGGKVEHEPNYNLTIIPYTNSNNQDTIYMTLWLGDPGSDGKAELRNASKDSFYTITYHLNENSMAIGTFVNPNPRRGLISREEIAYERAQSALPTLSLGTGKQVNVRGEFDIYNIDFDETSFLHMILLEDLMNVYLYMEEKDKPFALKKRLDIHYRSIYTDMNEGASYTEKAYISNSPAISMTLTPKIAEGSEPVLLDNGTKAMLEANTEYIHINISKADSSQVVNDFLPIFSLIMRYYYNYRQKLFNDYVAIFPNIANLSGYLEAEKRKPEREPSSIVELTRRKSGPRTAEGNIRSLQDLAPDLFVLKYARRCQAQYQPIIVAPEDVDAWRQRRIENGTRERQVMPFPKDNPKWYFVCPRDDLPYPGVKVNRDLPNADIYPYIPCCFAKDHMGPSSNSQYKRYIEGKMPRTRITNKIENTIRTKKITEPGNTGLLPNNIRDIIKRYLDGEVDMLRYGVIRSDPNSLLHCICTALGDPNYMFKVDTVKTAYIIALRTYIANNTHPALLRQELYDYEDREILSDLRDVTKFLDPALYYRTLEEIFNINIYTFTLAEDDTIGAFDIPRHKIFHSHIIRQQRPTLLIMKSMGSESDALAYPQCELIIDKLNEVKVFGPSMTSICHKALLESLSTKTWTITNTSIESRDAIYSRIDYLQLFKVTPVSQYIDGDGKMRGITLSFIISGAKHNVTVAIIPSQPENLPASNIIHRVDYAAIRQLLTDAPTGITRGQNGLIDGYWIRIFDIVYGIYIPIIETAALPDAFDVPGPPNPLISVGPNLTSRLRSLKKTLSIIVQIVKWLYDLAYALEHLSPVDFRDKYMILNDTPVRDSATYYDLSKIPRRLPRVTSIQEALRKYQETGSNLFYNNQIVMYDAIFLDRIIKTLIDHANLQEGLRTITRPTTTLVPDTFIENYFESESDFRVVPNSKIFMNQESLEAWVVSLNVYRNYGGYFNIKKRIDPTSIAMEPYIYQDSDGKIYLIQNVSGGSKEKAFYVATEWYNQHINYGFNAGQGRKLDLAHMIFGILSHTLEPVDDQTQGSEIYLRIIYYGTREDYNAKKDAKYAAMLELL